jgi:hypothetical protein
MDWENVHRCMSRQPTRRRAVRVLPCNHRPLCNPVRKSRTAVLNAAGFCRLCENHAPDQPGMLGRERQGSKGPVGGPRQVRG